jgi:hypothetical protein
MLNLTMLPHLSDIPSIQPAARELETSIEDKESCIQQHEKFVNSLWMHPLVTPELLAQREEAKLKVTTYMEGVKEKYKEKFPNLKWAAFPVGSVIWVREPQSDWDFIVFIDEPEVVLDLKEEYEKKDLKQLTNEEMNQIDKGMESHKDAKSQPQKSKYDKSNIIDTVGLHAYTNDPDKSKEWLLNRRDRTRPGATDEKGRNLGVNVIKESIEKESSGYLESFLIPDGYVSGDIELIRGLRLSLAEQQDNVSYCIDAKHLLRNLVLRKYQEWQDIRDHGIELGVGNERKFFNYRDDKTHTRFDNLLINKSHELYGQHGLAALFMEYMLMKIGALSGAFSKRSVKSITELYNDLPPMEVLFESVKQTGGKLTLNPRAGSNYDFENHIAELAVFDASLPELKQQTKWDWEMTLLEMESRANRANKR